MTNDHPRPDRDPGWWESIQAKLDAAPEPSTELCERVGAVMAGHLSTAKRPPQDDLGRALKRRVG
jgi:hypothetical protein